MGWAQDNGPTTMGLLEEPLIKIPTEQEFEVMLEKFIEGIGVKGIDHHFKARSFHEFWLELTDEPLQNIANIPTWEEEIENRIAKAKARIASNQTEAIQE